MREGLIREFSDVSETNFIKWPKYLIEAFEIAGICTRNLSHEAQFLNLKGLYDS